MQQRTFLSLSLSEGLYLRMTQQRHVCLLMEHRAVQASPCRALRALHEGWGRHHELALRLPTTAVILALAYWAHWTVVAAAEEEATHRVAMVPCRHHLRHSLLHCRHLRRRQRWHGRMTTTMVVAFELQQPRLLL